MTEAPLAIRSPASGDFSEVQLIGRVVAASRGEVSEMSTPGAMSTTTVSPRPLSSYLIGTRHPAWSASCSSALVGFIEQIVHAIYKVSYVIYKVGYVIGSRLLKYVSESVLPIIVLRLTRGADAVFKHFELLSRSSETVWDYDGPLGFAPAKAKWMRWPTYDRIAQQIEAADERLDVAIAIRQGGYL